MATNGERVPSQRFAFATRQPLQAAYNPSLKLAERKFLILVYLGAAVVRLAIAAVVYNTRLYDTFAGDSFTYDFWGWGLALLWSGKLQHTQWLTEMTNKVGHNGMFYWVAFLYSLFGRSEFRAAAIQCFLTSFTPILTYKISLSIFRSRMAARYAALFTAFFPSMVIWSCLLLKDGLVVLLIATTVFCTLKIGKELKLRYALLGLAAMLLIFPIRGYVFYFVVIAVVGGLLLARFGKGASLSGYVVRVFGIILIAAIFFGAGFDQIANQQIETTFLEQVQRTRLDLARSAASGFRADADVSTLRGALSFMPTGIAYLLFAPFPWQTGSVRQALALPEVVVWYGLFPFSVIGIIYTYRKHLREAVVIFLFVIQLTCFYGIFCGNVGTAHRQRTQIYVFYLIFTGVGLVHMRRKYKGIKGPISD